MNFRNIRFEPEWLPPGYEVPRHRHLDAYATILLDGRYEQAGYSGRWIMSPGEVLLQPTLDCHADRMLSRGLWVQRLPWPREEGLGGAFRVAGVDAIIAVARRDPAEAAALLAAALPLAERLRPAGDRAADLLAAAIAADGSRRIGDLAEQLGLVRETATRSFGRTFGVPPARFAAELRLRAAWLGITGSRRPLGQIALETGFADQAHMTRAIRGFAAQPPGALRRGRSPAAPG